MSDAAADRALGVGEILARLGEIMLANAALVAACLVVLTAIGVAAGQLLFGIAAAIPGSVGGVIAHYYLLVRALDRLGLRKAGAPNRFWDFWGLLILSGIGVALGLAVFIVPGLYISARWAVAGAVLVNGDRQVGDALDTSWTICRPSAWAIVGTSLVIIVSAGLIGLVLEAVSGIWLPGLTRAIFQLCAEGVTIAFWLVGIAVYSLLCPGSSHLEKVFA
ncbi:MAG: hypothetical protein JWN66_2339 [Sphingomonas bacterium]|uniref:hypothetical protein n=1 Tax=Sphingomonas bacterium TaxID=1895847 RepID=UPI002604FB2E|nr:hypothetical protein [Sphingomonas bacterium]MDB5705223.1 hypothetical protein [Sphingomonas bacterium]